MDARVLADDRGLSEAFAVWALVGITLLMALTVGVYVLAVDVDDESATIEFGYDYDGNSDALLIRYVDGERLPADQVVVASDDTEATWAQLARLGTNESMAPGDAVQLSSNGIWGRPITGATELQIHRVEGDNRIEIGNWTA